jgi:YkoP-like protein
MTRRAPRPVWFRTAISAYDWLYRLTHGLNAPESEVGSALRLEIRTSRWTLQLSDGTSIGRGDLIGVLHVNNERVSALRSDGLSPIAIGLEFRRRLIASLHTLARLASPDGRLAPLSAFAATTIFHEGLGRLGFETEPRSLRWPKVVAGYQRALMMSMHGAAPLGLRGATYQHAARVWISRQRLIDRFVVTDRPHR